jgi:hypothetical protein
MALSPSIEEPPEDIISKDYLIIYICQTKLSYLSNSTLLFFVYGYGNYYRLFLFQRLS